MSPPSGICSVCGRTIRLKMDGTVFHHGAHDVPVGGGWYRRADCDGTNQPPKPLEDR